MTARTRIEHYFASGEDFDEMLAEAIRETPPEKGRILDTLGSLLAAFDTYGMRGFMSEAQFAVMWRAAGFDAEPQNFAPDD